MDIALGLGLIGNITSKESRKEPIITDKIKNTSQFYNNIYSSNQINKIKKKVFKKINKEVEIYVKINKRIINDN